jgi:adenylate cyclase
MRAPNTNPNLDPTPEMIQLSLRKLLASDLFARSVRHSRFLRYTVEETLAGRGSDLNQYVLGLEIFDRKGSFDPNSDPIVRVGAMRLRAKLKAYYETEGQKDSVLIEFPFGYMPVFRWRQETREVRQSGWLRNGTSLAPASSRQAGGT